MSNIHASLNNIDKLRYYTRKVHQELHPYGSGAVGLAFDIMQNNQNICEYVQRQGIRV